MRCGVVVLLALVVDVALVVELARLSETFVLVLESFVLMADDTLFCLALVFVSLLKSERTRVDVLFALSLDKVLLLVALVAVERSLLCLRLRPVAEPLFCTLLLSLLTTPFTFLLTPLLLSNACLFFTDAFLEVNDLEGLEFAYALRLTDEYKLFALDILLFSVYTYLFLWLMCL